MAGAGLDDVFIDDITFPAADGYLLGATLFLPRGAKRHAVLINSATAAVTSSAAQSAMVALKPASDLGWL